MRWRARRRAGDGGGDGDRASTGSPPARPRSLRTGREDARVPDCPCSPGLRRGRSEDAEGGSVAEHAVKKQKSQGEEEEAAARKRRMR